MKLIQVSAKEHYQRIGRLYESAFPECEKKAFFRMVHRQKQENRSVDMWYLEKNGDFAGLAITMNDKDLVLLDYFAIDTNCRGGGLGSEALRALQEQYRDRRFFLEIESIYGEADNQELRQRRRKFYLNNDMQPMGIMADVFGTEMELLGYGDCAMTFEEYTDIYAHVYGRRKARHVKELPKT